MEVKTEQIKSFPFLMVFIGAVFGIIAFFINWQNGGITGLDMYNDASQAVGIEQWKCYVPLFVLILSVITLIVALVPLFNKHPNADIVTGTFFLFGLFEILGIIALGVTQVEDYGQVFAQADVGMWLALIGSILVFVVSLYNVKLAMFTKE